MSFDPERLAAATAPAAEELGIPGVSVGVLDQGRPWTWSCGVTSVEHPLPVTEQTIFQIGSISKLFVATTAMALVDQGRLDLDIPVRSYVPDLHLSSEELTAELTMSHLLTHTAGWVGDYFADTGDGDDALAAFVTKLAKAPQLTATGSLFSYNNTAFNLAAHVVATVAGTTYERAVRELVLRPLGMRHTFYRTDDAVSHRVAIGHRNGRVQPWRRNRAYNGAGGVLSCVSDMLVFGGFHLGEETSSVMSRAALDSMQARRLAAGSLSDELALTWRIDRIGGQRVLHHGGTTNGYMTDLRLVPDLGLAWVVLTNSGDHEHQLDRVVMSELLGSADAEPTSGAPPSDLSGYVGRYEAVLAGLDVVQVEGRLVLTVSTPRRAQWDPDEDPPEPTVTELGFRDADRVVALDMPYTGHRGEFVRDAGGRVAWFRWDGRLARRVS